MPEDDGVVPACNARRQQVEGTPATRPLARPFDHGCERVGMEPRHGMEADLTVLDRIGDAAAPRATA